MYSLSQPVRKTKKHKRDASTLSGDDWSRIWHDF